MFSRRLTQFSLIFSLLLSLLISTKSLVFADIIPAAPDVKAKAYLLIDYDSGKVITEKDSTKRIEPASLTKLMTAYVVMHEIENGSISLDDEVLISEKAWRMKGSLMFIEVNTRVSVRELILGLIIQSGNDASVALAEHVAGSEEAFANLMNEYAKEIGMHSTNFKNSTGWPAEDHYTTAADMALLTQYLIRDFPEHYALYKVKSFTFNGIHQFNRNRLLWRDDDVDGVKTGHTESAGYNLIASGKKKNMRLISIVIGTSSERARENASLKLLNYGFRFYETFRIQEAGLAIQEKGQKEGQPAQDRIFDVYRGEQSKLTLGIEKDLFITVPRGQRGKVKAQVIADNVIIAPIAKGNSYGHIEVKLGDAVIVKHPLVALQDIKEGGYWRCHIDNVKLLFQ